MFAIIGILLFIYIINAFILMIFLNTYPTFWAITLLTIFEVIIMIIFPPKENPKTNKYKNNDSSKMTAEKFGMFEDLNNK